jgi:hypothetical protein
VPRIYLDAFVRQPSNAILFLDHSINIDPWPALTMTDDVICDVCTGAPVHRHNMFSPYELQDMPKIFQEAIVVCRTLKIKYLWIDSLCMI